MLLELFEKEVSAMTTSSDKLVTAANTFTHDQRRSTLIVSTVEAIVCSCGPLLSKQFRNTVENLIAETLICLSKGVMQPSLGINVTILSILVTLDSSFKFHISEHHNAMDWR
jgi:hypothetical protein